MTKIEQDAKRVNLYNNIDRSLEQLAIHKANADYLTSQINGWMDEIKAMVEDEALTQFTPEDFDAVLALRDSKLPRVEAEVTAKEFAYYAEPVTLEPVVELMDNVEPEVEIPTEEPMIEQTEQ